MVGRREFDGSYLLMPPSICTSVAYTADPRAVPESGLAIYAVRIGNINTAGLAQTSARTSHVLRRPPAIGPETEMVDCPEKHLPALR